MKEKELRERATCAVCGERIGASMIPAFFVIRAQRYIVDMRAVQRQSGLESVMGGAVALAQVMGPNENLANPVGPEFSITICADCNDDPLPSVEQILESEHAIQKDPS